MVTPGWISFGPTWGARGSRSRVAGGSVVVGGAVVVVAASSRPPTATGASKHEKGRLSREERRLCARRRIRRECSQGPGRRSVNDR